RIINERISECPLEEAAGRLRSFIRESAGVEREITECVTKEAGNLFDWSYDLKYYIGNMDLPRHTPEFEDPIVLKNLVTIMGQRELMLKVMKKRMRNKFMVTIGSENQAVELNRLSVVTHSFCRRDNKGLLGIVGPTRMSYKLVLPILDRMVRELGR
ncbi:MAG TPA: HrcA family transcriptional regulator, partial [Candidatus Krumholzibacteriaceae bacterium]|nr:HrcA family transcriptional regulator [Candidatus Krumholzibacteriaceae bacterium]